MSKRTESGYTTSKSSAILKGVWEFGRWRYGDDEDAGSLRLAESLVTAVAMAVKVSQVCNRKSPTIWNPNRGSHLGYIRARMCLSD